MNKGIVEAWTGVIRLKPMLSTASIIHSASGGVNPSQARDEFDGGFILEIRRIQMANTLGIKEIFTCPFSILISHLAHPFQIQSTYSLAHHIPRRLWYGSQRCRFRRKIVVCYVILSSRDSCVIPVFVDCLHVCQSDLVHNQPSFARL